MKNISFPETEGSKGEGRYGTKGTEEKKGVDMLSGGIPSSGCEINAQPDQICHNDKAPDLDRE